MKTKILILSGIFFLILGNIYAQKFISKTGHVWFNSSTPLEEIEAHNNQCASILNSETRDVMVSLLIRSFDFEKDLMQEHFNENYMESDKFPKSTFKGKITNIKEINFSESGLYSANVEGKLTIHGVTNDINNSVNIEIKNGKPIATGEFIIKTEDYNIKIPKLVKEKIAKEITIKFEIKYD